MGWANAPGLRFFEVVVAVDLVFVILAGVSYFSSAISEEKEEMTLGLLRMTNLNPLSILLGKSTSRLCAAILLFVAQIPFTLLAITLGGISLHQVFAAYLTLAAFLVFVSNLALLASVSAVAPPGPLCSPASPCWPLRGRSVGALVCPIAHSARMLKQGNAFSDFLDTVGRFVLSAGKASVHDYARTREWRGREDKPTDRVEESEKALPCLSMPSRMGNRANQSTNGTTAKKASKATPVSTAAPVVRRQTTEASSARLETRRGKRRG